MYWLVLLASCGALTLFGFQLRRAKNEGKIRARWNDVARLTDPTAFWMCVFIYVFGFLSFSSLLPVVIYEIFK